VGHPSGTPIYRAQASGPAQEWQNIGQTVAKDLLSQGAQQILDEVNANKINEER
jgi:porphobilinogen deaminase